MEERISYWRSLILGRSIPINYLKSPDELPAIRERGRHVYDFLNESVPEVGQFIEHVNLRETAGRATPTAEIYVPKGQGPFPVVIHLHGGAWFSGNARSDRKYGMRLTEAGFLVVNVDYALAPEQPFPAALEDVVYAARWVVKNIARYGGDPKRIGIGGSSAGGNLATAAALVLHADPKAVNGGGLDDVEVRFSALLNLYAMLDIPRWLYDPGYSAGATEIPVAGYLGPNFTMHINKPLVSPVFSTDLDKLPPTYLVCGALDAMLGQTLHMTSALVKAGIQPTVSILEQVDHEFMKVPEKVPGGMSELRRVIEWLRRHMS